MRKNISMKKIAIVSMLVSALALVSCSGNTQENTITQAETGSSSAVADSSASETTLAQDKAQEVVNLEYEYTDVHKDLEEKLKTDERMDLRLEFEMLTIKTDGYNDLNTYIRLNEGDMLDLVKEKLSKAQEIVSDGSDIHCSVWFTPIVVRADTSVFSVEYRYMFYFSGSNSAYWDELEALDEDRYGFALTMDTANTKVLQLQDIVTDVSKLKDVSLQLVDDLDLPNSDRPIQKSDVEELLETDKTDLHFTLGYDSINFRNGKELDYRTDWEFSVPLREYKDVFQMAYMDVPASYITNVSASGIGYIDLDNDGTEDVFTINQDGSNFVIVTKEGKTVLEIAVHADAEPEYTSIARLPSGAKFMYVSAWEDSAEFMFEVDINSDKILMNKEPEYDGTLELGYVNPNQQVMAKMTDIIGTIQMYEPSKIEWNGKIAASGDLNYFYRSYLLPITKVEVEAEKVNSYMVGTGEFEMIPVGEELNPKYLYVHDGEYVIFERKDGSLVRILFYREDEWQYKIDGLPVDEVLENIIYAG